ncbi:MAG: hypothetical protein ACPGYY_00635 [Bacteroidia bacterium]
MKNSYIYHICLIFLLTLAACKSSDDGEVVPEQSTESQLESNNLSNSWKTYAYSDFLIGSLGAPTVGTASLELVKSQEYPLQHWTSYKNDNIYLGMEVVRNEVSTPSGFSNRIFSLGPNNLEIMEKSDQSVFSWLQQKYLDPLPRTSPSVNSTSYYVKAENFKSFLSPYEFANLERANQGRGAEFDARYAEINGDNISVVNLSEGDVFIEFWNKKYDQKLFRTDDFYYRLGGGLGIRPYGFSTKYYSFCSFGDDLVAIGMYTDGIWESENDGGRVTGNFVYLHDFISDEVKEIVISTEKLDEFKLVSMNQDALAYTSTDRKTHKVAHFTSTGNSAESKFEYTSEDDMYPASFFHDGESFYLVLCNVLRNNTWTDLKLKAIKFSADGTPTDLGDITIKQKLAAQDISCEAYKGQLFVAYQDTESKYPLVQKWTSTGLEMVGGMGNDPFTKTTSPISLVSRNGKLYAFIENDLNDIHKPPCCPAGYALEILEYQE